jgi:exosortase
MGAGGPVRLSVNRARILGWTGVGLLLAAFASPLLRQWDLESYYFYGWAVIPSALWFAHTRARFSPARQKNTLGVRLGLIATLAPALALARLLTLYDPSWRLALWGFGAVCSTLFLILLTLIYDRPARSMLFPACFLLAALPWPTFLERTMVDTFTETIAAFVTAILQWNGASAVRAGHTIELHNTVVEVGEACSGIRSFQALFVVSLFLGETFLLHFWSRALMLPAALITGFLLNGARAAALALISHQLGVDAEHYHDSASVILTGLSFGFLYLLASRLPSTSLRIVEKRESPPSSRALAAVVILLALALAAPVFYLRKASAGRHFADFPLIPNIEPPLPAKLVKIPPGEDEEFMRASASFHGTFASRIGTVRLYYFRWNDAEHGMFRAMGHTPDYCMGCRGAELAEPPRLLAWTPPGGLPDLPLEFYRFRYAGDVQETHVFRLLWNGGPINTLASNTHLERLREALSAEPRPPGPVHLFYAGIVTTKGVEQSAPAAIEALNILVTPPTQEQNGPATFGL